jgi:hypothetical protein
LFAKLFIMKRVWKIAVLVLLFSACKKKDLQEIPVVLTANGNISSKLNEFRSLLGNSLNTTTGVTGGRREINWDAVPDSLLHTKLPKDFFNPVGSGAIVARQRGLIYTESGSFMVSNTNFAEINANTASEFVSFSGDKVFANTEASLWDIAFEKPGQRVPATVKGFGAVFADVDVANSTFMEFFSGAESLGKFFVPAQNNLSKFSFLGVHFTNKTITKIQIGHAAKINDGQKDLSQGGSNDHIVLDDFLYSEPVSQ